MRDIYDINLGFSYLEVHTQKGKIKPEPKRLSEETKCGLGIVGGFFCCVLAILIAM